MTATEHRRNGTLAPMALTMGEPAGIGGEITMKSWLRLKRGKRPFFAIDDPARLRDLGTRLGLAVPVEAVDGPEQATGVFAHALPVCPLDLPAAPVARTLEPANAAAVRTAIERAVGFVMDGRASAVVTNPIHKEAMYASGFPFPGHTEFLAHLAGSKRPAVMMLACPSLRVVPVTIHMSLAEAVARLKTVDIVETASIVDEALRRDFSIARPRLAVAGLNPHAGEGGAMGVEDADVIAPAIRRLNDSGIDAFGPLAPDSMFSARIRKTYDAAICMYHDQALIPVKTIDFEGTVNVTLGLPFVRTSPDHGTALDIAGRGEADASSLVAALELAAEMACRRAAAEGARFVDAG